MGLPSLAGDERAGYRFLTECAGMLPSLAEVYSGKVEGPIYKAQRSRFRLGQSIRPSMKPVDFYALGGELIEALQERRRPVRELRLSVKPGRASLLYESKLVQEEGDGHPFIVNSLEGAFLNVTNLGGGEGIYETVVGRNPEAFRSRHRKDGSQRKIFPIVFKWGLDDAIDLAAWPPDIHEGAKRFVSTGFSGWLGRGAEKVVLNGLGLIDQKEYVGFFPLPNADEQRVRNFVPFVPGQLMVAGGAIREVDRMAGAHVDCSEALGRFRRGYERVFERKFLRSDDLRGARINYESAGYAADRVFHLIRKVASEGSEELDDLRRFVEGEKGVIGTFSRRIPKNARRAAEQHYREIVDGVGRFFSE